MPKIFEYMVHIAPRAQWLIEEPSLSQGYFGPSYVMCLCRPVGQPSMYQVTNKRYASELIDPRRLGNSD